MEELVQLIEASTSAAAKALDGDQGNIDAAVKSLVALKDFKGGKKLRALTKHQDLDIKATAAEVLNVWKMTVAAEAKAVEKTKEQLGGLQPIDPPVAPGVPSQRSDSLPAMSSDSLPLLASQASDLSLPAAKRQRVDSTSFLLTPPKPGVLAQRASVTSSKPPATKASAAPGSVKKPMKVPQTSDQARNKIRQQIAEALSLAEEECPDCDAGARAAELESAVLDQNRGVNPKYKAKIRSLWVNLKDPKNPDFRAAVLAGDVTGAEAVNLKPEEMASKVRQEENQRIRDAAMFEAERGQKRLATTDQFQCGKCKKRQTSYYQMQTRSADEPMTTFVICQNCDHRWKFC